MAECIGPMTNEKTGLPANIEIGDRRMVKSVFRGFVVSIQAEAWGLGFVGERETYGAAAFRKIVLTDTGADRKVKKRTPVDA